MAESKRKIGQKLKQIVGTVAPLLGKALGGPLGGVAGKAIRDGLGVETDAAALELLTTDADSLAKLKEIETAFEIRMKELDIDIEKLHAEDRQNARDREVQTGDRTPRNLAYLYSVGFFLVLAAQFYIVVSGVEINPAGLRILDTALGVLFAMVFASKDYYFGSSVGSKLKTQIMSRISGEG